MHIFNTFPKLAICTVLQFLPWNDFQNIKLLCRKAYYCTKERSSVYHFLLKSIPSSEFQYFIMQKYNVQQLTINGDAYHIMYHIYNCNISLQKLKKITIHFVNLTIHQFSELMESKMFHIMTVKMYDLHFQMK